MKKSLLIIIFVIILVLPARAQFTKAIVSLTGEVIDQTDRRPATVTMVVYNSEGEEVQKTKTNSRTGYYFITGLHPGKNYTIDFVSGEYLDEKHLVKIPPTKRYAEFSRDFLVKPKRQGAKIRIAVPPFELRKTKLRYGADYFLEDYLGVMLENPGVNFKIACYPDENAGEDVNLKLTRGRCMALKEYFVSGGVDTARLAVEPHKVPDPDNPLPKRKRAKGKRYIGTTYLIIGRIENEEGK
jgi:outer membrane protein OmpA-like peptidoglycan-associated protein